MTNAIQRPIPAILARHPTAGLSPEPTPLYELERLSARLGHRVHVLREDLTRFALGGNKVRKLDYLLGDALFLPSGSTATQVGLVLGQALTGYDTNVIGVAISQPAEVQRRRVLDLALSTAQMLGVELDPSLVRIDDRFLGDGYALPSPAGRAAVQTFAHLEDLLLDQVYTGKAAACLIHHAENGLLAESANVLFLHTGGNFGLLY